MKKFIIYILCALSTFCAKANKLPNIVLIYADDQGWMDTGYQTNGQFQTPTLDKMVKQGMTFTNAYTNAANCQPARACLLSGNYTARHHVFAVNSTNRGPTASLNELFKVFFNF